MPCAGTTARCSRRWPSTTWRPRPRSPTPTWRAELIPLCRGRCCTLHFPLSNQDLDEHIVKWQYLRPYIIKQRPDDHYCVHSDPETRGCTVYANRPRICRTYDCRNDKRIWVDFE